MQSGRRAKMYETRLIKRTENGWESATYVWDNKESDAELLTDGKQFEFWNQTGVHSWHAPSSSECASCHVDAAGYVLGLNTAQLNRDSADGKSNQILQWAKQGIVDLPSNVNLKTADKFCSPYDEGADLETRSRVWLDVNCAMCHQPNGPGNANIDLRFATSLEDTKTVGIRPAQGDLGIVDAKLIAPGHPEQSLMIHRIETLSEGRMPSIGSNQVDEKAVKILADWIRSMR
jgi:mono/diheme cytochrome c family protein